MNNEEMLPPGSTEAGEEGCTCPVIDNHYGEGYRGVAGCYVMVEDCKIHGIGAEPLVEFGVASTQLRLL